MSCNRVRNKYAEYLLCIPSMASTNDVAYCSLNTTARTAEPTPTNSLRRRETTNRTVERLRAAETTKQSGDYTEQALKIYPNIGQSSNGTTVPCRKCSHAASRRTAQLFSKWTSSWPVSAHKAIPRPRAALSLQRPLSPSLPSLLPTALHPHNSPPTLTVLRGLLSEQIDSSTSTHQQFDLLEVLCNQVGSEYSFWFEA